MSFNIQKLYFSPVKSISLTNSSNLYVQKNIGIKNDRIFVFTRNISKKKSKIIEKIPNERNLNYFLTLRNSPFLNKYNFDLIENTLFFKLGNEVIVSINYTEENNYDILTKELMKLEEHIKDTYLLLNKKFPFFDTTPANSISLINVNSIRDFENKINKSIEIPRFRGNIYVNDLKAWEEFNFIGKNIIINNCQFKVTGAIPRCSATNLVPNKTEININLPHELKVTYNHINMGIYLTPLNEGEIKVNDKIKIE